MPTRITNAEEFNIRTLVDKVNGRFIVTVDFASEGLPYYPVSVAAIIACRAPTTMYKALQRGMHGLKGVLVEDVVHITHESLVEYLSQRDATKDAKLIEKAKKVKRMARRPDSRLPASPRPVVAEPAAQDILDAGMLDYLDDIIAPGEDAKTDGKDD